LINEIGWKGKFDIFINGKLDMVIFNKVMDTVLDQMVEALRGETPNLEIKYLALGTSNTPVTNTDTKLGNEMFRTPIISQTKISTAEIVTEFIVLDTEAIGTIEEIGIFGGSAATSSQDTGTLISRILWHKVKTNSEEITFRRTDKVVRV
jgi:hypothetical protein